MKFNKVFAAFLLTLLVGLFTGAAAQSPLSRSNTVTSFDGQYLYYNDNSGHLARTPVTPVLFTGVPTGPCIGTEIGINKTNGNVYYCSNKVWVLASSGGGGGSSLLTSFQFGSNPAILGTNNYLQLTGTLPLVIGTQTGTGSVIDPYIVPLTCPTCGVGTVTSVGMTVNGGSSSGLFSITGSPVNSSGSLNLALSGTSGGLPYFSSATALSASGTMGSGQFVLGGGAGSPPNTSFSTVPLNKGGTGATTQLNAAIAIFPTPTRAGDVVFWDGSTWNHLAGNNSGTLVLSENSSGTPAWLSPSGAGTVTSVGLTINGGSSSGIFAAVTGSPVTTSGSLNYNLSGASGGIPYFSSSTVLSSSGTYTAGNFLVGGGAGSPPAATFSIVPVANGGTGLASGTSGGILCYTGAGTLASSTSFTQYSLLVGLGTGSCPTSINPPSVDYSSPYIITSTPSGGGAQLPQWGLAGTPFDAQTGTTATLGNSDRMELMTTSNSSPVAVTYNPTLYSNYTTALCNIGAGLATITPSSGTFNGAASGIVPNNWCGYMYNDNTNVRAGIFPSIAAFPSCADSGGNHLNFTTATGALSCGTSGGGGGGSVFPITVSGTVNSGGIPCFDSTTNEKSSALLTQYGVILGGGAGGCVAATAQGGSNFPLIGQGASNPVFSTISYPTSLTSGGALYASSTTAISGGGILNTGVLVKGGGAGAAPTNSLCDEGATTTNVLTCTQTAGMKVVNLATGTSPPTCAVGTGGAWCATEGTAATAVASVDDMHADSTQKAWMLNNNNTGEMAVSRVACANVTPVTVAANVTSDQLLMACTLSANLLNVVGRTLTVRTAGVFSTAAASVASLSFKIKLCTVSGCGSGTVISPITTTTGATAALTASNLAWSQSAMITTQTAGASSAYETHGTMTIDLSATAATPDSDYADVNTATVGTIDSTGTLYLQVTAAASAGSTSNSFTQRQLLVEVLN